ncbi:MAG: metal-sensitive transcriptional regulator [Gemmatimonadota bacterium]
MPTTRTEPAHAMGIAEPTRDDLRKRLARIRGQVEGIARMVDEERYCPEILHQFSAVHAALRGAERALLTNHLERCATHAISEGGEAAAAVRQEIVDLFHRFLR